MGETATRRKRINRLKKMILGAVAMAILIPVIICVILGIRLMNLSKQVTALEADLEEEREAKPEGSGVYTTEIVVTSARENGQSEASGEEEAASDTETGKKIYLTFDDGPSSHTDEILDILKAYDVKATFFVVGKTDETSVQAYQRIVEEGHTLAMHSYSHKYEEIYQTKDTFTDDLEKLQEYLYRITGVWPRYYRFPGGSSNTVSQVDMQELITWLSEKNITYFDWNIASGDAVSEQLPKDTIVKNCLSGLEGKSECMILMHDAAEKKTTVEALPEIISQIRMQEDAVFLPITDDTVPIQHVMSTAVQ
jgi:peptidoglycan/xylan/chitin deacetylase (PgdA/CDA1 family)